MLILSATYVIYLIVYMIILNRHHTWKLTHEIEFNAFSSRLNNEVLNVISELVRIC